MNVLVINLTRFGDLLQTQPVISAYARGGNRVGVVCLANFASAGGLLRDVDGVFAFPGAKLLARLDSDWREAVRLSTDFKREVLAEFRPDLVINLTPSVAARILARDLAGPVEVRGFGVDELGFNADSSSWAAFLQLAGNNRGASPFNICDLFQRAAGVETTAGSLRLAEPTDEGKAGAAELLDHGREYIAFQLGASETRRQWPVERFAALGELCLAMGLTPVLLGTKDEQPLGEAYAAAGGAEAVNCMGRTSLPVLAGVLDRCKALVTNDTGTMHLAAGLGVPLVAMFLATAQPWDTGPYREGAICLEPDMDCHPCGFGRECGREESCREAIPVRTVFDQVRRLLGRDPLAETSGARVWRMRRGEDGFLGLESLSGHGSEARAAWIAMQRHHLARLLDGRPPEPWTGGTIPDGSMRDGLLKTMTEAVGILFLLSQQGALLAVNPRQSAKAKFMATWQRLHNVLNANHHLNILGLMWNFESQAQGESLDGLRSVVARYHGLAEAMRLDLETRHES